MYPRLVVAGTSSGVGKTTTTLAILAGLRERGRLVQPFKAGPDFIDPGYHLAVTGRMSRNLDGWMLASETNRSILVRAAADADLAVIEGMMGLFDSSSPLHDSGSTAELAKQLEAPVILVVDGSAMARSAAAMVQGYARFDPAVQVAGVLFNRVSSEGHYKMLKAAVEQETDVMPVGYLRPDPTIEIADRHLGLIMATEHTDRQLYPRLAAMASETVDLDCIEAIAKSCPPLMPSSHVDVVTRSKSVRVGVAKDQAFCFYYPENLECLEAEGAELVPFSPLHDPALPDDLGMVYLGGGYPELHGEVLAANVSMKEAIKRFAEQGGTIYAECGGMMYLTHGIRDFNNRFYPMIGIFPAEAVMQKNRMTLGYRTVTLTQPCVLGSMGLNARGHEYHYSRLLPHGPLEYACLLQDAEGRPMGQDGLVKDHVLGLYSHVHFGSCSDAVMALVHGARRKGISL